MSISFNGIRNIHPQQLTFRASRNPAVKNLIDPKTPSAPYSESSDGSKSMSISPEPNPPAAARRESMEIGPEEWRGSKKVHKVTDTKTGNYDYFRKSEVETLELVRRQARDLPQGKTGKELFPDAKTTTQSTRLNSLQAMLEGMGSDYKLKQTGTNRKRWTWLSNPNKV